MSTMQKVIKYVAIALAVLLAVSIIGGALGAADLFGGLTENDSVLNETKTYDVQSQIRSLRISIYAADFTIRESDHFSVESNLKHLSVSEENGVLTIIDERKYAVTYSDASLTLYIPADAVFEQVSITTGAAKLTADTLSANTVKLELGAGDVSFGSLNAAYQAEIEGGAGKITIAGGTINELDLDMGVGELNLTAALLGSSELNFGVGESNLTLLGDRSDYKLDLEKGIGSITIDGKAASDFGSSGNGKNRVEIEGGVGAINVQFRAAE